MDHIAKRRHAATPGGYNRRPTRSVRTTKCNNGVSDCHTNDERRGEKELFFVLPNSREQASQQSGNAFAVGLSVGSHEYSL